MKLILSKKPGSVKFSLYYYVVEVLKKVEDYVDLFNRSPNMWSDLLYMEGQVPLKNYYRGVDHIADKLQKKTKCFVEGNIHNNTVSIFFGGVEIGVITLIYEGKEKSEKNTV